MAVDRVRPHFFEIDVGSDFVLDVFWPPSRPVWSPVFVRTSPRVQPRRLLQRLRAENAVRLGLGDSSHDFKPADMYSLICIRQ